MHWAQPGESQAKVKQGLCWNERMDMTCLEVFTCMCDFFWTFIELVSTPLKQQLPRVWLQEEPAVETFWFTMLCWWLTLRGCVTCLQDRQDMFRLSSILLPICYIRVTNGMYQHIIKCYVTFSWCIGVLKHWCLGQHVLTIKGIWLQESSA